MMIKGGARIPTPFEVAFPAGCVFVPDSIAAVEDYDARTKVRTPQFDKVTGSRVWQCRVMDADPELGAQSREVVIKILADHQPVPPVGAFMPVEFEGLMVTPWIDDPGKESNRRPKLMFSYRATAMVAPKTVEQARATKVAA
ncbi:transcriptional regulator [Actinoplanes xinjiangensis]